MLGPYLPSRWVITGPSLADDPDVFPLLAGQSFITAKAPMWSTGIAESTSGRERRTRRWSYPKWRFEVQYEVLRNGPSYLEQQRLLTFFNLHAGMAQEFFYFDPSDNVVTGTPFGTGDGTSTTFQLKRTMGVSGFSFSEPVRALNGAPVIYINGVATTAFTVGAYGQITFTTAPAAAASLSWDGSFLFLCRFDNDEMEVAEMMQGLWSNSGLSFMSVKR